ncbi:helix-turn-helix transcriptional regulator [Humibacillus xanthopallidus]|uniref:helix-turn-helix transcriptional regulator n=1 Tax=Humibacillus xanthopallidus TaxID=412689 RepID=UPI0038500524
MSGDRPPPVFDAARFVLRARREADLSQRDLADVIGLSRATIGRLETGATRVGVDLLGSILALAGLRLAVLDGSGREVQPVPDDVLRDNADRRFPSHLDVLLPEDQPAYRGVHPRPGQPPATGWYHQRRRRADLRRRRGTQPDHPTHSGERQRRRAAYEARVAAAIRRQADAPDPECTCLDECFELACLAACPCQCEPERPGSARSGPPV